MHQHTSTLSLEMESHLREHVGLLSVETTGVNHCTRLENLFFTGHEGCVLDSHSIKRSQQKADEDKAM